LAALLAIIAFPTLRAIGDTNVDGLNLIGVLLILWAYRADRPYVLALGLLLASIKPQTMILVAPVVAYYALRDKPLSFNLRAGALVALVVGVSWLWGGERWLAAMTTNTALASGISLPGILPILGVPGVVILGLQLVIAGLTLWFVARGERQLTRENLALLIAASMLISPYTNGHSMLLVFALAVMPLLLVGERMGIGLYLLYNVPVVSLFEPDMAALVVQVYWCAALSLTWGLLLWRSHAQPRGKTA
jgi:hypothetical protein